MLTVEEQRELVRWLHRVDHLRWRTGNGALPEHEYVVECWMPLPTPEWALELAATGAPGSQWCPRLNPALEQPFRDECAATERHDRRHPATAPASGHRRPPEAEPGQESHQQP